MAGQTAQVLREDDDDPAVGGAQGTSDAPVLRPVTTPPIRNGMQQTAEPEYEALEVDDEDQPLGDPITLGQEERLSDGSDGSRPLIGNGADASDQTGRTPQRGRESRKQRREREKSARDRDKTELMQLRREVGDLRQRQDEFSGRIEPKLTEFDQSRTQAQLDAYDTEISKQSTIIQQAGAATRKAMQDNDPDAFTTAQELRENAVVAKARAEARKEALAAQAQTRGNDPRQTGDQGDGRGNGQRGNGQHARTQDQPRAIQLTPVGQRLSNDFRQEFDWLDPQSSDPEVRRDSRRLLFLDSEVAAEGFDPNTREYWDELRDRAEEVMPHLVEDEAPRQTQTRQNGNGATRPANGNAAQRQTQTQTQVRRGPMTAGAGDRPAASGKIQVKVTPGRKEGLIQAGILNADGTVADRTKFTNVMKKFAEHDRANGTGQ